jgi:cytochrome c oxidase subunit 4
LPATAQGERSFDMSYDVSVSLKDSPHGADDERHAHPNELQYIKIAALLAVITLAEVAIYYIEAFEGILVPMLIVMSTVKFFFVVGYFMHLKFDDKRLTMIFSMGMVFALATFIGTWVLMRSHQVTDFFSNMF